VTVLAARLRGFVAAPERGASSTTTSYVIVAALSAAAGVIHLAMTPSHIGEWAPEGAAFCLAGWLQLAVAFLALTRRSQLLLPPTIIVNATLIGAWTLSRTAGLPVGPHSWHPESVTFIDAAAVGIEVALIAVACALIVRPALLADDPRGRYIATVASIATLALATAALASPSARNHAAGAHGDHAGDRGLSLLTNGHHHDIVQYELAPATQAALDRQLKITREVARLYPTVADAEAAGYKRAGPFSPGIGAHYIMGSGGAALNFDGVIDDEDARTPMVIIYDGTDPDSAVAGFMFYSMSKTEPEGFAGPNDVWHYHENVCLRRAPDGTIDAPLGPDNAATDAQCAAVGGSMLKMTQWMLHVWSVPGYDDVDGGVFAEVNPELDCPDNTYYQLPFEEWVNSPLTTCRS
jgi:hypothetical protein